MAVLHLALFRWKTGTTADQVVAIAAALAELPATVPSLRTYQHGTDLALGDGPWDFGIVAGFDDVEGWRAYDQHPAHQQVRTQVLGPHVAERGAVQIGS